MLSTLTKSILAMIKRFNEYLESDAEPITTKKASKDTAGIAILYGKKILLVHPTNGSWNRPIMGIPKGQIEEGEDIKEAAIRETAEEIGIKIDPSMLSQSPDTVDVFDKNGNYKNTIYYYVCRISALSDIGLEDMRIPRHRLQREEVDWAGFINLEDAYGMVSQAQRLILDRIS